MEHLQVLAKAELLGCPIDAAYQKTQSPSDTEIKDDNSFTSGDVTIESKMVVYGKDDSTAPKIRTLTDVLNDFGNIVSLDNISDYLPRELTNITDEIGYSLNQVYYMKQITEEGTATKNNDEVSITMDDTKRKTLDDYAIWLQLHAPGLIEGWPIDVNNVSVKVWNTERDQIIEDMKLTQMEYLLSYDISKRQGQHSEDGME